VVITSSQCSLGTAVGSITGSASPRHGSGVAGTPRRGWNWSGSEIRVASSAVFRIHLRRRPSSWGHKKGSRSVGSVMNLYGSRLGKHGALLCILALSVLVTQTVGVAEMASTTTTHTKVRVTTTETLTETTTAVSNSIGPRGYVVLLVLVAAAASSAVLGGYLWGKRRTRKSLLGVSD